MSTTATEHAASERTATEEFAPGLSGPQSQPTPAEAIPAMPTAADAFAKSFTEGAIAKIHELLEEDGNVAGLRLFVQGGGCHGFTYGMSLEDDPTEDDVAVPIGQGKWCWIDALSAQYLDGVSVDYKETEMGAQFVISNPNAVSTCGCGSSFGI